MASKQAKPVVVAAAVAVVTVLVLSRSGIVKKA